MNNNNFSARSKEFLIQLIQVKRKDAAQPRQSVLVPRSRPGIFRLGNWRVPRASPPWSLSRRDQPPTMGTMADRSSSDIRVEKRRCRWAGATPHMIRYHDTEWGRPVHDDRR